jgi:cell division inhibitor SulA
MIAGCPLVAPPASVTQAWLRDAGLNRERIILMQPRGTQSPLELTREVLRLGRSHTVVSWINPISSGARQQLASAARSGDAQSLNIRLG